MVGMRLNPQIYDPLEKAWNHKLKKDNLNPASYGFSTFLRELAAVGMQHYYKENENDF